MKSHFLLEVRGGLWVDCVLLFWDLGGKSAFLVALVLSVYLGSLTSPWRSEVIWEQGHTSFNLTLGLRCLLMASSWMWFVFVCFGFSLSWKLWSDQRGSLEMESARVDGNVLSWLLLKWLVQCLALPSDGVWWYYNGQAPSMTGVYLNFILICSEICSEIWCASIETIHFLHNAAMSSVLWFTDLSGKDGRFWDPLSLRERRLSDSYYLQNRRPKIIWEDDTETRGRMGGFTLGFVKIQSADDAAAHTNPTGSLRKWHDAQRFFSHRFCSFHMLGRLPESLHARPALTVVLYKRL